MSFSFFSRPHPLIPPVASLSISQLDAEDSGRADPGWQQQTWHTEHGRVNFGGEGGRPLPLFLPAPSTDLSSLPSSPSKQAAGGPNPGSPPPLHLMLPVGRSDPSAWDSAAGSILPTGLCLRCAVSSCDFCFAATRRRRLWSAVWFGACGWYAPCHLPLCAVDARD